MFPFFCVCNQESVLNSGFMIDATTDTNCLLQELQMFKKKKVFILKSSDDSFAYYKVSV